MTYIPTPQRTDHQRVVGEFYPLQKAELIALKSAKLINNAAFVHLALRYENPFCVREACCGATYRPIEILPKEFALRWGLPESSIYAAIGKLKHLGIIAIKTNQVVIEWVEKRAQPHSQRPELFSDPRTDSQSLESILRSENDLQDLRKISEILENRCPEPLPLEDYRVLQTLQTIQTYQTCQAESEVRSQESEVGKVEVEVEVEADTDRIQSESGVGKGEEESDRIPSSDGVGEGEERIEFPLSPTADRSNHNTEASTPSTDRIGTKCVRAASRRDYRSFPPPPTIPQDLIDKLEELHIPLDGQVRGAIASHHLSQAYGAANHVFNTLDTIKNPRAVFLYQLPKQPVEKAPPGLSTEFISWYEKAISSGIVEDVEPQHLSRDYHNEPLVRLKKPDPFTKAPYCLVEWQKLQADPNFYPNFEIASTSQIQKLLTQLKLVRWGKNGNG
jgi:hypothetical protein